MQQITQVTAEEAKEKLADLILAAVNGDEVVIRDNGSAVKLVPVPEQQQKPPRRKAGSAKGIILYMADDFDAPMDETGYFMDEEGNYTK